VTLASGPSVARRRAGVGAQPLRGSRPPARRLALAALGFPALLAAGPRDPTRFVHFVHCARTDGRESDHDARFARRPRCCDARLRQRAAGRPPHSGWATVVAPYEGAASGGTRGRRYPAAATYEAPRSAGTGSARAQRALRDPTRRICSSAVNKVNGASYTARPCAEHRRAAGAQRRLPHRAPLPGTTWRDARMPARVDLVVPSTAGARK